MSKEYWEEEAHTLSIQLSDLQEEYDELKKQNELTLAKIWDCKYEEDKIYLIIDHAIKMSPRDLVKKYKKELGY